MRRFLTISPRDPLIVRDGRPFTRDAPGSRAYTAAWPAPSVTAGAVRTLLGRALAAAERRADPFHDAHLLTRLRGVPVAGPLAITADGRLGSPPPLDCLLGHLGEISAPMPVRPAPLAEGEGCDLPGSQLWPAMAPSGAQPLPPGVFWSHRLLAQWLAAPDRLRAGELDAETLKLPCRERRVHVGIDERSGTAAEGQLFLTSGLAFPDAAAANAIGLAVRKARERPARAATPGAAAANVIGLAVRVELPEELSPLLSGLKEAQPLGGERRLAWFQDVSSNAWRPPEALAPKLAAAPGLRLVLATPAIFSGGWLPGWLDASSLEGSPPGLAGLRLRLRSACLGHWQAISGWDLAARRPKPIRRLVPAGSVYFFEVLRGGPAKAAETWLEPVSDDERDRLDGFGLALWGAWDMQPQPSPI